MSMCHQRLIARPKADRDHDSELNAKLGGVARSLTCVQVTFNLLLWTNGPAAIRGATLYKSHTSCLRPPVTFFRWFMAMSICATVSAVMPTLISLGVVSSTSANILQAGPGPSPITKSFFAVPGTPYFGLHSCTNCTPDHETRPLMSAEGSEKVLRSSPGISPRPPASLNIACSVTEASVCFCMRLDTSTPPALRAKSTQRTLATARNSNWRVPSARDVD
jgi:hypothetical protein